MGRRPVSSDRTLSVVIPVLNEAASIARTLRDARRACPNGVIIVVDGGSSDATVAMAEGLADIVAHSPPGRARQMNAGAGTVDAAVLLFLHADTQLPDGAERLIAEGLADGRAWGRFDVAIAGRSRLLPLVAAMMNLRSRSTGVATGDQAIFATREAFAAVEGFPQIALMEDVAMSKRLRRLSRPACVRAKAITSGRRWDANGAVRTIAAMWLLRLAFVCGVPPGRIANLYARLKAR
ncbi:TIGR04283 family arsenosugar biosynthesis glycosyltransferase [Fulvimarina sp. 2208YS6-2-32]|uniref:TIGR04283 family arsenosugar biosynthesis glycosyltransferase n=1 Tax=Fulvimarina uroteuthidis TaxID=3098149 RepID=A0ABU5HZR1_9HYPH|nr:TIGR04283 family arsenosugar biosynthesis glycosyltransferase [Fulvimarina sp. 2208YS6-2-32]MDY8108545.1 TIGR04283 family arsenosugar biosynthesis glycosyltransferase [Fulvimarina sp. 2208YS6-2-32]